MPASNINYEIGAREPTAKRADISPCWFHRQVGSGPLQLRD